MSQAAHQLITSAKMTRRNAEMLLNGVTAGMFARLAVVGGKTVQSNHPAFVFGHLSIYPASIVNQMGIGRCPANPPRFDEVFANGKPCLDDPNGSIYPAMEAITSHFFATTDAVITALETATDAHLSKPNPGEGRMKEFFPTVGDRAAFLLGGHAMLHLGQVSAWRRMMGLPSAM